MERLKGKKQIEHLFMTGKSVGAFPLRMVYLKNNTKNTVGVSVSKKHFKTAVDRNRIKRLIKSGCKRSTRRNTQCSGLKFLYDDFISWKRSAKIFRT